MIQSINVLWQTIMKSSPVDNKHKTRLGRRVASLSLVVGLIFAYNFILFDEDGYSHVEESKNSHRQLDTTDAKATEDQPATRRRKLLGSNNGPLPPPEDIADASYIVKPFVGASFTEVFETMDQTALSPPDATASSYDYYMNGSPSNVLSDTGYNWRSNPPQSYPEWLEVDLGLPEEVAKLTVDFGKTALQAFNFELQCRKPLETEYTTLETYTGYTAATLVYDSFVSPSNYCRYLRLYFTAGYNRIKNEPPPTPSPVAGPTSGPGTYRMLAGDKLYPNDFLLSENGLWKLKYQTDSNLVLYDANESQAFWETFTWGNEPGFVELQDDGNLVMYGANGGVLWATNTYPYSGAWFRIQDDRNLILADANNNLLWTPNTYVQRRLTKEGDETTPIQEDHRQLQAATELSSPQEHRQLQSGPTYGPFIGIQSVKVWRMPRVASTQSTTTSCGSTYEAVKNTLLSRNANGGVITSWDLAEFFQLSATPDQAEAMAEDPCCFSIEPNYKIWARGTKKKRLRTPPKNEEQEAGGNSILKGQEPSKANDEETRRRLGIPEFNLKETSPANWGLERISTRGSRNGKYIWVSEGFGTDIYIFDTGIHDSEEFQGRPIDFGVPSDSRINATYVCAGQEGDEGEHGSFLASIIGGKRYGVGRSATIHPMQILDINGEGSLATFLCGMDKLIQDGIDYFAANAPYKMKGVVNLSVGTNGKSDIFDKAAEDFVNAGYTVVIAAGDFGGNACHYSPTTPGAIRVGALKDRGLMAGGDNDKTDDSNYGECIDIWAPGENIRGMGNEDFEELVMSGTSVAAGFVSGTLSMFMEEIASSEFPQNTFSIRAKEKMLMRSERDVLGDVGAYSPNRMLQTSSSPCQSNAHCEAPKVCMYDGACGRIGDYFN